MFLVHFTHYSGGESGNFVRNLLILSYNLSLKFGEALLLVRTEYWTNESFAPNLRSQWHIPQIWAKLPLVEYYVRTNRNASPNLRETVMLSKEPSYNFVDEIATLTA